MHGGHYGAVAARRTTRLWTDEEKWSICFQTAAPGVSVAQMARRYVYFWADGVYFTPRMEFERDEIDPGDRF